MIENFQPTISAAELHSGLHALANYFGTEREDILEAWRDATRNDPGLGVAVTLTRTEFRDHMGEVLQGFERQLRVEADAGAGSGANSSERESESEHGAHRWQQGYDLSELAREWGLFNVVMVEELDAYQEEHPHVAHQVFTRARRILASLVGDGIAASVTEFSRLQRAEAQVRFHDLNGLLDASQARERQRGQLLREASHDLRGSLGVVRGATSLLNHEKLDEAKRREVTEILERGVDSLQAMLSEMLDLARLDAGLENREVRPFDVSVVLRELGESAQLQASEKGLTLSFEGPPTLQVEGDALHVRRIAQNLLLNAIKYTPSGRVSLEWEAHGSSNKQWVLRVQDSGPGLAGGNAAPLARELESATQSSREVGTQSGPDVPLADAPHEPNEAVAASPVKNASSSEGVGLMIVKRLCELLDATIELDSGAGKGSLFRVIFPSHYPSQSASPDRDDEARFTALRDVRRQKMRAASHSE